MRACEKAERYRASPLPDREIAPGVWLRQQRTKHEYIEILIPPSDVATLTRQRRDRIASSFSLAHLLWNSGPTDTTVRDEILPLPEWDDVDGLVAAAAAANIRILEERLAHSYR
jgi:hypothetical protein